MRKQQLHLRKLVLASLFTALTLLATRIIQIPLPGSGYVHLGDCLVLISGWLLGPVYGAAAAGLGSMLADVLSPYAFYAPATLVIKAFSALLAGLTMSTFRRLWPKRRIAARAVSGLCGGIVVPVGYFFYELYLFGLAVAWIDALGTALNVAFGIACAVVVDYSLEKISLIDRYFRY